MGPDVVPTTRSWSVVRAVVAFTLMLVACAPARVKSPEETRPFLHVRVDHPHRVRPGSENVTALLRGNLRGEEWLCPIVEWWWGDGTRSTHHETPCSREDPQRVFEKRHEFRWPGRYEIHLRDGRCGRPIAQGRAVVMIHD